MYPAALMRISGCEIIIMKSNCKLSFTVLNYSGSQIVMEDSQIAHYFCIKVTPTVLTFQYRNCIIKMKHIIFHYYFREKNKAMAKAMTSMLKKGAENAPNQGKFF